MCFWVFSQSCKSTLSSHWYQREATTVGHDMGSLTSQDVFCHLHWNHFIQNITHIGKCRNYFHFPGIISLSCSLSHAKLKHSNSSCRAACNSTTVHKFPLLKSFFGDGFAASWRNEAKNVSLELQMCALNNQDDSMYFSLLKIGSTKMEGLTGYLR